MSKSTDDYLRELKEKVEWGREWSRRVVYAAPLTVQWEVMGKDWRRRVECLPVESEVWEYILESDK